MRSRTRVPRPRDTAPLLVVGGHAACDVAHSTPGQASCPPPRGACPLHPVSRGLAKKSPRSARRISLAYATRPSSRRLHCGMRRDARATDAAPPLPSPICTAAPPRIRSTTGLGWPRPSPALCDPRSDGTAWHARRPRPARKNEVYRPVGGLSNATRSGSVRAGVGGWRLTWAW
jgi:hypothetical protein